MVDMKNDLRIKLIQEALDEFNNAPKSKQYENLLDFHNEVKRVILAGDELEDSWIGLRLIDTSEDAFGNEIETFKCGCGRTHSVQSGGDIACCPCEFENEGEPVNTNESTEAW